VTAFVTSVRVEKTSGPHEYVTVWIRGQNVGTLVVGQGDGLKLEALLLGGQGADEVFAVPFREDLRAFVRTATDEEQRAALSHVVDGWKGKP
jgi:hypothetical protein